MKNWRDEIIKHFSEPIPALTIVADPDELLCDESLRQDLNEKGIELVGYHEPVAFRYLFETKHRDALAKASLCLVVRTKLTTFDQIPYDLLARSVQLSFSVGDLFPGLSPSILGSLDKADYERLYEVRDQYQGSGSDSEAIEFLANQLYGVYIASVNSKTTLLKVLLSIHYADRSIPELMADYMSDKLSKISALKGFPLKEWISSSGSFYNYLQIEWNNFIQGLALKGQAINEIGLEQVVPEVLSPFLEGDIRSRVDNLFAEGKLRPVKIRPGSWPKWVAFGIESDIFGQARLRLLEQIYHMSEKLVGKLTYKDWMKLAYYMERSPRRAYFLVMNEKTICLQR